MNRYVYDFDEPSVGGRELLGGKGIGLAEMTQLGIPVPAGFTITTDACRAYMRDGGIPAGLDDEIEEHIARLEERAGKRFGDPDDPLLVSVRSGAAMSMPGMMDSILNVGLNDDAVRGLARTTGNEAFAQDCYRRLVQMFGETVDGVHFGREPSLAEATEIYERETGRAFPQDAREQLRRAVVAVFESWNTPRAQVYRHTYGISDDIGTAVNVVQMVFGNKGETSATGVCFTRNPSTGEQGVYGEYLVNAQGEDVVAGIRTPQPLEEMGQRLPEAYAQLLDTMARLEQHYRDMQDIEFTVEEGKLFLLQTRAAKRTAAAALKAAVDMTAESLITREDAIARIDPTQLDQLLHPMLDPKTEFEVAARGLNASPGAASGKIVLDADTAAERGEGRRGGHPRPLGDDARRHSRADPVPGRAHRARRHDLARGRRRTRHGQAVRRRLRGPRDRRRREDGANRRARATRGRRDHHRRRHGARHRRRGSARPARDQRRLRDDPRVVGPGAPDEGARERRQRDGLGEGARVRRRGHRPVPHRAHVLRRGTTAGCAGDDPRFRRGRAPRRARSVAAVPAVGLRGDLRRHGGSAGHHSPPRPAAARVSPAARRGDGRADAQPDQSAHGGEPDARHARLPTRHPVAGDLRDAGARDRARGEGGAGTPARRDHASRSSASRRSCAAYASSPSR